MGQTVSRQRLTVVVLTGAAGVLATACLLSQCFQQEEEETPHKEERPSAEAKQADKDRNEQLRLAAEEKVAFASLPLDFNALQVKRLLGRGDFGTVELVEHAASGDLFCLKSLSKGYIVKNGMQSSVRSERLILMLIDSKFVMNIYGTYNRPEHVCFLLEPCLGGDLYHTYNTKKLYGCKPHAQYYVGSVVLALAHMHGKSVVYRDVKPENCVLDQTGRLKLNDMGLAKLIVNKTYTTCGTPDYFSPEVIASTGHGFPVDWWTSGVLLFELLVGHPPFEAAYPMKIYSNVMKGIKHVAFPAGDKNAEALIKAMLKQKPEDRLPVLRGGIINLKQHKWYADFDWHGLESLTLAPPYEPVVKSVDQLTHAAASEADEPPSFAYADYGSGWAECF